MPPLLPSLLLQALAVPAPAAMPGHLPYGEAAPAELVTAPDGFAVGQPCRVRRAMLPDLRRLIAAESAALGPSEALRGVSCFRSLLHQQNVFCGHGAVCRDAAQRAVSVAPSGRSEHATGYAIDFAVRPQGGCRDVEPCFAGSAAGAWLRANGPAYGFELSFPSSNRQGVTWEPWHWRWVGTSELAPGARAARALFATARSLYPAAPAVAGTVTIALPDHVDSPLVTVLPPIRPRRRR